MKFNLRLLCAAQLCALLAACGGNGSATTETPPTVTPPPAAVGPSIVTQPANMQVLVGQTATFSATAAGSTPLSYQWQKGSQAIAGATSASYTTPATTLADSGTTYLLVVSNSVGSVSSSSAKLTVAAAAAAPSIVTQPADMQVVVGQTATFTVTAAGSTPLTYQWQKGGQAIAGATSASYTTLDTTLADSGSTYLVVVSNSVGHLSSNSAKLTVAAAAVAPSIVTQPADMQVVVGQTATFTVAAAGSTPLTYQWQKGGQAIAGATSASYTTPVTTLADSGSTYLVVVSNSVGHLSSNSAKLTVNAAQTMPRGVDVVTYKNDTNRTGQNLSETTLTLTNVASSTFGLLRSLPVDGRVDAQPLYTSQLALAAAKSNAVFVATEHDSVYAFDSDSGAVLWHVSLLAAGEQPSGDHGCGQVTPEIGITSTPVIDRAAGAHGTIYVVAMSLDTSSHYHHRLHALDLTTGAELLGGPTEISATFTVGGVTSTFDPGFYEERAALLLSNGQIYTSWTSHCDSGPYGGWIIAYSQSSLARTAALNIAANSNSGPAIWMSGGGPAVDSAGNIYLLSANGAFETTLDAKGFPNKQDFGNSFLKISSAGAGLAVLDYFAMFNEVGESNADLDLGSGGEMLLPDLTDSSNAVRHLMVGAGKDGNLYVVDRDNMGKFNPNANNNYQTLSGALTGGIWSTPAYFNNTVYYGSVSNNLKAFTISSARLNATPASQTATQFSYPGTAPSVSANGTANGIVWAHENTIPGVLHAYDAANLAHELYNSNQAAGNRDQFGSGNKYITPTVADGKVFVGSSNKVAVFGLLH